MSPLSILEQLSYSTIRIECSDVHGAQSVGTGFIFNAIEANGYNLKLLVTNKHVIRGADSARILFHLADEQGLPQPKVHRGLIVKDFESLFIPHPDPEIDLAVASLALFVSRLKNLGHNVFYRSLSRDIIVPDNSEHMTGSEQVVMVGYPNGLWDSVHNMPLFRRGTVASHPNFDWEGRPEVLVDIAAFQGSSGSPVLVYEPNGYLDRHNVFQTGGRMFLLGVLHSIFEKTLAGDIEIIDVPTVATPISLTSLPLNIGILVKARKILDFIPLIVSTLRPEEKEKLGLP